MTKTPYSVWVLRDRDDPLRILAAGTTVTKAVGDIRSRVEDEVQVLDVYDGFSLTEARRIEDGFTRQVAT